MVPLILPESLPTSFRAALSAAKQILKQSPRLTIEGRVDTEAEQLLVAVYRLTTGVSLSRMELFNKMQGPVAVQVDAPVAFSKAAAEQLFELAQQRVYGVPLQYLIGVQWFGDHEYEVGPAVLIPRPETEVLLDTVFRELSVAQIAPELGIEVGLGSGVLSIELLSHFPKLKMIASELMEAACQVAIRNSKKILGLGTANGERLTLVRPANAHEGIEVFRQTFEFSADFILSNPPYLIKKVEVQSAGNGEYKTEVDQDVFLHEPHEALFAPKDEPLYFYNNIMEHGRRYLKPRGFVFMEVPHERAQFILERFRVNGWFAKILPDLTGRDRVLVARLIPL